MTNDPKALVQKLWDFCDVLRDDGLSYGDYLEQLTYLLFLKMADEQYELLDEERVVPEGLDWPSLLSRSGAALESHYNETLDDLGVGDDMLGVVFRKARNRIQNPAKLELLIKDFIDGHEWLSLDADLKGDAYEGLIEKTAREGARGAGQYFTPRALISAIVDVMQPGPADRICDPACGTGGFFLGAYRSVVERYSPLDPDQREHLRSGAFTGWEIADLPSRLCAMNMLLHGIESPGPTRRCTSTTRCETTPASASTWCSPTRRSDGRRRTATSGRVSGQPPRTSSSTSCSTSSACSRWAAQRRWWFQTTCCSRPAPARRSAAGSWATATCTRCCDCRRGSSTRRASRPTCCSSSAARAPNTPWTRDLWVYDLRTNKRFTLKQNPITRADLDDFVACYRPGNRDRRVESERFKKYTYEELIQRDKVSLDVFWLRDDSLEDTDNLPAPGILAAEIVEDLQAALEELQALAENLNGVRGVENVSAVEDE